MLSTLAHERAGAREAVFAAEWAAGFAAHGVRKNWASTTAAVSKHEGRLLAQRGERACLCARLGRLAPTEKRARVYRARTTWVSREIGTAARVEDQRRRAARRMTAGFVGVQSARSRLAPTQ